MSDFLSYTEKLWRQRYEDNDPLYCTYDGEKTFQTSPNAAVYCCKCSGTNFTNIPPKSATPQYAAGDTAGKPGAYLTEAVAPRMGAPMTEEQNKLAELVALSEKATQGEWRNLRHYSKIAAKQMFPAKRLHASYARLIPVGKMVSRARDGKGKANGDFVVALVNWFRANHASLRAGHMNKLQDLP